MSLIGYARVSTTDQSLAIQRADLKKAGCASIFAEQRTGTSMDRPVLLECLASLIPGNILVVTRIDRLARSTKDLLAIIGDLEDRGVKFRAIHQPGIDTASIYGKFMLQIMAAVAELEANMTAERRREGIARAMKEGKYKGRPRPTYAGRAQELYRAGTDIVAIRETLRTEGVEVSIRSIYRYVEDLRYE